MKGLKSTYRGTLGGCGKALHMLLAYLPVVGPSAGCGGRGGARGTMQGVQGNAGSSSFNA